MEGIVAKRCLRNTGLIKSNNRYSAYNINRAYDKNIFKSGVNLVDNKNNLIRVFFLKTKIRLWIQLINSLIILSIIMLVNIIDIDSITNNEKVKIIKAEYKKSYSNSQILKEIKKYTNNVFMFISPIIPDKIEYKIEQIYREVIKGNDVKNNYNKEVQIYEEEKINNNDKSQEESNVRYIKKEKKFTEETSKYIESVSAISTIDLNIEEIKIKNITFIKPTNGIVTSRFGAREKVFNELEGYHTGIDIANKIGTEIISATDGKVVKVSENDYNGKFVEIETKSVITKYLHMSKIVVNQGDTVKAGDLIGLMGETGLSTGPHLHFEIVINNVRVDPEKLIKF